MSDYHYEPLNTSEPHIRLIKFDHSPSDIISIHLIKAPLHDSAAFEALSYTWGNTNERTPIKIGNQILTITPNLYSFLTRLRQDETANGYTATYWADQICINQKDIPERNSQVALMASIYRESHRTLVWLGEAEAGDTAALRLLREIDRLGFTRGDALHLILPRVVDTIEGYLGGASPGLAGDIPGREEAESGLLSLMNRTCRFTRAWIVQEVALARECTMRVSESVFQWESMDLALLGLSTITKRRKKTLSGAPVLNTKAAAAIRHIQYCKKDRISKNAQARHGDFLHLLGRLSPKMDCTDPRDRIYAYLSLQEEGSRAMNADYALTVEEVYMESSAALAAARKKLDIFAYTRYPPIGPGSEVSNVPSWAIDWRAPSTMSRLVRSASSSFRASGDFEYKPIPPGQDPSKPGRILRVHGNVVDVVGATSTRHEFPNTSDPFTVMKRLEWSWILEMSSNLWIDPTWNMAAQTTNTALHLRVAKVLLCYDRQLDDADGLWEEQFELALRALRGHEAALAQYGHGTEPAESELLKRFTSVTDRTSVRALYTTRQRGLVGLAPPLTRAGDLVCIIHGSDTPIILRKSTTPGRFHVVGQSYLEDWMHGDQIWWSEESANIFELE